ncbi:MULTISPECIES: DUF3072 domain-containing protein [Nocardioides]|uniref:DUF3072 domain-containing protein n=1 Tax=Nocardioides kribbensis TaxID=305517 RepID=A0ABV1NZ31_9ACTN|nr:MULTISPECIES: DUF3072 domain-containing protein [Nocardioides]KQQ43707.1 transposase [Nocardioides sp. Leaf307]MCM3515520.1 DUF3072 domain-containing protein [Nocardioides sp. P86]
MTSSNMSSNDQAPEQGTEQTPSGVPDGEVLGADNPSPTNAEKDPNDWVTGDEPITGAQKSYLDTLAREAGETLPADLTKAEASEHIDRLQASTGRGADS